MQTYPNLRGQDFYDISKGEDIVSDISVMDKRCGQKMQNVEYRNGDTHRRKGFGEHCSAAYADEASALVEYVDASDVSRVLLATDDGKVIERTSASAFTDRVTGLNAGYRGAFEQTFGAVFFQNGKDSPRRGDGTTWRVAGAPLDVVLTGGAKSAGAITGTHIWMVTACIKVGSTVILESDHSNYVTDTLTSEQKALSWAASTDVRVNWYRLYRTKNGLGTPFYLAYEANATSYTDNTLDSALPSQIALDAGRNGPMPLAKYITTAGQRMVQAGLVDSGDPLAAKAVHLSVTIKDLYDMEYYPSDNVHKFYLPGIGGVTAAIAYSQKDELQNNKDLFLSQPGSCYILRGADPYGSLETVSTQVGVRGGNAVTQWGRWLFFVSMRGLEFVGPNGEPVLISQKVNPYFFGGGTLNDSGANGDDYFGITIWENKLLIRYRSDSGLNYSHKTLVMDLERFNAYDPRPENTAFFTTWSFTGGALGLSTTTKAGLLLVAENKNRRLLISGDNAQDKIGGALVGVDLQMWSCGYMSEQLRFWKTIRKVLFYVKSESDFTVTIEADNNYASINNLTVARTTTGVTWNKVWNKNWGSSQVWLAELLGYVLRGRMFQLKIACTGGTEDFVYVGIAFGFTQVLRERVGHR